MKRGPTFAEAAQRMVADMRAASNPVKAATIRATESRLRAINETLGAIPLGSIQGVDVRNYVAGRVAAGLSGSTVNGEYQVIRKVIESVVDKNLNCVYKIQWATKNLGLPSSKPSKDRKPCTSREAIEKAIAANLNPYSQIVAFLGFTGMRLGEAVACRIGTDNPEVTHWDSEASLVYVRTAIDVGTEHSAKTENSANRIVDLCAEANEYLKSYVGDRCGGFLFTDNGGPLERNRLYRAARKLCGPYHGLRRARITHLYKCITKPAQEQIIKFWSGHGNEAESQTEEYSAVRIDAAWRREFAERAGIGFSLPVIASPQSADSREDVAAIA